MEEEAQTLLRHLRLKLEALKADRPENNVLQRLQETERKLLAAKKQAFEEEKIALDELEELGIKIENEDADSKLLLQERKGILFYELKMSFTKISEKLDVL